MAASIEGVFTIIDRASGPMKKMETQAAKTMAAIQATGKAADKQAAGSTKSAQAQEKQAAASAKVTRATKDVTSSLDRHNVSQRRTSASTSDLTTKLGRLGGALGGLARIMTLFKFAALAAGITTLVQAVGVLAGGLVALVPALTSAAGAFAAFPTAVAAAVQGVVVFRQALSGIGEAIKAGTEMQQNAGNAARDYGDQTRMAANQVRQAEHGIMLSQRSSRDAQEALTDARRAARRELTDMKLAALDAALGERGAALSLRRAKDTLARAAIDPGATDLDMSEYRLGVDQAKLELRRSKEMARRAQSDNKRTQRRGVGGNRSVRSAREGVSDATWAATEAQRALADAIRQSNRLQTDGTSDSQAYSDALKELPPVAQDFAKRLVGLRGVAKGLQEQAANGLIPGLDRALTSGLRAVPMIGRVWQRTGKIVGDEIARVTGRLTTPGRLGDLEGIGNHNATVLGRMTRGAGNLAEALVDLMVAARPFTNWLSKTVLGWTEAAKANAAFGRESGETADKLDRTRSVLERFGRIASNLWDVLTGLGRAARPLGERLWDGAERGTQGWADYLNSVEGAAKAQEWFNKLYEPLHEMGQLVKDLGAAWARLTVDPTFVDSLQAMQRMVPSLERFLRAMGGLTPALVDLFTEVLTLFADLPLNPLELFLKALTKLLRIINKLIEVVPGLGYVMSALFGAAMLSGFGKLIMKIGLIRKAWLGVKAAVVATGALSVLPNLIPGGGGGRGKGGKAPTAPRTAPGGGASRWISRAVDAVLIGGAAKWAAKRIPGAGRLQDKILDIRTDPARQTLRQRAGSTASRVANSRAGQGAGRLASGAGKVAKFGLKRVATPLAIASGIADAAGLEEADPFLFLKGSDYSGDDDRSKRIRELADQMAYLANAGNPRKLKALSREIEYLGYHSDSVSPKVTEAGMKVAASFDIMMDSARKVKLHRVLGTEWEKVVSSGGRGVKKVLGKLDQLEPGARDAVGDQMRTMVRVMQRRGVLTEDAADKLVDGIDGRLQRLKRIGRTAVRRLGEGLQFGLTKLLPAISPQIAGLFSGLDAASKKSGVTGREAMRGLLGGAGSPLADRLVPVTKKERRQANRIAIRGPAALQEFQRAQGLVADGVMGPKTEKALDKANVVWKDHSKKVVATEKAKGAGVRREQEKTADHTRRTNARTTADTTESMQKSMKVVKRANAQIKANSEEEWSGTRRAISTNARAAKTEAGTALGSLMQDAIKGLVAMGYSQAEAAGFFKGGKSGGGSTLAPGANGQMRPNAKGGRVNYAGGGRIPGVGLLDTVPVAPGHIAAPGELIVNRHTENRVKQNYGVDLGREVAGESRPHSAPIRRAATGLRLALGPYGVGPVQYAADHAGGNSHLHVAMETPRLAKSIANKLSGQGWSISEATWAPGGVGGMHASPEHYDGRAFDANTAADETLAQVTAAARILSRFSGKGTANFAGAGGGLGKLRPRELKKLRSRLAGVPGAYSQGTMDALRKGILGKAGGPGGTVTGGHYTGPLDRIFPAHSAGEAGYAQLAPKQVNMLAAKAGLPGQTFEQIAHGESNYFPGVISFDGGHGLWQMTPRVWGAAGVDKMNELGGLNAMRNPWKNALMAKYLYQQAGNSIQPWYGTKYVTGMETGGRVADWGGWNARGGTFDVDSPTVFGAGEAGKERVTITPVGKQGGGSGMAPQIHIGKVVQNEPGDLSDILIREWEKFAENVGLVGMEDDS